jgi:small subunit ribosomal protein S20
MANIKSSKKAAKQNAKRRAINLTRKSALKTTIKKVLTAIEKGQDVAQLKDLLRNAEAKLARAKGKGLLHSNTASRKVSRLAKRVNAAAQKAS